MTEVEGGGSGGLSPPDNQPETRLDPEPEYLGGTADAWVSVNQPRDSYLTTTQLAKELSLWQEQVKRWCKQWFGDLPPGRRGPGLGYRIPLNYRYVARAWMQCPDPKIRKELATVLSRDPKDWVVVVGKQASTHYTDSQVVARVTQLLPVATQRSTPLTIVYVGDKPQFGNKTGREAL